MKLVSLLKMLVSKSTPNNVKKIVNSSSEAVQTGKQKIKQRIQNTKDKANEKISELKQINIKSKVEQTKQNAIAKSQEIKETAKTNGVKGLLIILLAVLMTPLKKLKTLITNLSHNQILAGTIFSAITVIAGISIMHSTNTIFVKERARRPANIKKIKVEVRPIWYQNQLKQIQFRHVSIPITINSLGDVKSLTIDVTVKSSTQLTALYIKDKSYLFSDLLMTEVHPIIPSFPLEDEGKIIIKDKIKEEFNKFLKGKKYMGEDLKGEVEQVSIEYLLGA